MSAYPSGTSRAPKPKTSNWKETTLRNTAERTAREAPLHRAAFRTYQPDPNADDSTNARYFAPTGRPRLVREHGGTRHNLLRWGSLLLRGVYDDDIEVVEDALAMPLANPQETVRGGRHGAAFDFGGDAVVTFEQIARENDITLQGAKDLAAAIPRYYSDYEWRNIEAHLREISTYFPRNAATFDVVVLGDSALHLAVRQGSMKAARRLMLRGFDPLRRNGAGDTVAKVLGAAYEAFDEELRAHMEKRDALSVQYAGVAREDYEQQRVAAELRKEARAALHAKRDDIRDVAVAVVDCLEDRDALVLEPLASEAWKCDIEGVEMSKENAELLATRPSLLEELRVARDIAEATSAEFGKGRAKASTVRKLFKSRDPEKAAVRKEFNDPDAHLKSKSYDSSAGGARDMGQAGSRPASRGTISQSIAHGHSAALSMYDRYNLGRKKRAPPSLSSLSSGFFDDVNVADWVSDLDHAAVLVQSTWRAIATRTRLVRAVLDVSAARLQGLARGANLRAEFDARPLVKRRTHTVYPGQVNRTVGRPPPDLGKGRRGSRARK